MLSSPNGAIRGCEKTGVILAESEGSLYRKMQKYEAENGMWTLDCMV